MHVILREITGGGKSRRIKNLKKQMCVKRGLTDSWSELTDMCVNRTDPPPVMLRQILYEITAAGQGIRVSEVLCICTHVTDVCIKSLEWLKFWSTTY